MEGKGSILVRKGRRSTFEIRQGRNGGSKRSFRPDFLLLPLPAFLLTALFLASGPQTASSGEEAPAAGLRQNVRTSGIDVSRPEPLPVVLQARVKEGETISSILGEWLNSQEIDLLVRRSREIFPLQRIHEGHPYLLRTLDNRFLSFEYEIDCEEKLVIVTDGDGFRIVREPIPYEAETVIVCGTIRTSLFEAAGEIGEIPVLALKLADMFGWDIDFALDVKPGDSFKAVVEKRYRNGEFAGYGKMLAAEFVNQGKAYQGFLYENTDGRPEYYDANGRSLRRAFLKTPLDFARISSGFSWNRFHPIKKEWCPHPAIDYAAPVGTPVRTVGDGIVLEAGYSKGGGRFVRIRHTSIYETYYLHLSRFASGIGKGRRVRQGQVIGYVGSTGMSTGPHLDFRMKRNGQYVNPKKIIAPASPPVPRERIEAFRATIEPLVAHLEAVRFPIAMETPGGIAEPGGERGAAGRRGYGSTLRGRGGL
jgi:murein DD-endopeptidase MepM/ murein hydrolase activator NlpD